VQTPPSVIFFHLVWSRDVTYHSWLGDHFCTCRSEMSYPITSWCWTNTNPIHWLRYFLPPGIEPVSHLIARVPSSMHNNPCVLWSIEGQDLSTTAGPTSTCPQRELKHHPISLGLRVVSTSSPPVDRIK
jgi:hypothetical protein